MLVSVLTAAEAYLAQLMECWLLAAIYYVSMGIMLGSIQRAHPTFNVTDRIYRLKTNIDIALGLQWGMFFNCHKGRVDLAVAYEFVDWIHQNQFRNFPDAGLAECSNILAI
jgi:hypothetical protein